MTTTNITTDSETSQRIAIIRTQDHAIRITEDVDGPARCSLVPTNPRHRCLPFATPFPMNFDQAVAYCSAA